MAKTLPSALIIEKNKLSQKSPWLVLLKAVLANPSSPSGAAIYRLVRNFEDVYFGDIVPAANYLGHWKMNEDSWNGTPDEVVDNSSAGNHGTAIGTPTKANTDTDGKIDRCGLFSGGDMGIDLGSDIIGTETSLSICAWVKVNSLTGENGKIVDNGKTRFWVSATNNTLRFSADGGTTVAVSNNNVISLNTWHFVCVTRTANSATLYVDGIDVTLTSDCGSLAAGIGNVLLGSYYATGTSIDGRIDNAMIFDTILTQDQINHLYNQGAGTETSKYRFTAFAFEMEPTKYSSQGEIPAVSLRVSNVSQTIQAAIEEYDGAVGSLVTMTVVHADNLTEDFSDLELIFEVMDTTIDANWVTFVLGAPNPLRKRFPAERFIPVHCNWLFKSVECGYSGGLTTCNRTYADCLVRGQQERFGGFLGLRSGYLRIV